MLSRVIADFNVDKEEASLEDEEITAVVSKNGMPLKKKKSNPIIINNEFMNIKEVSGLTGDGSAGHRANLWRFVRGRGTRGGGWICRAGGESWTSGGG